MFQFLQKLIRGYFLRHIRVRPLTVRANSFRPPPQQLSFFDANGETKPQEPTHVHRTAPGLDLLHARFGTKRIAWARSIPVKPNYRIRQ